ncbi:hypothetical protein ACLF3G_22995 [Falsiroseomonas sp. HC035]|uniref:hypothetical protein n=1 Tax=Falsiroseomonas sp. HC035 TaxID=3390999 RepID=UPI003D31ED95
MILGPAGALAAGAWLGPGLAALAGLLLLRLAGAGGEFLALFIVVALSLLLGAPVALLAALRGTVALPLGLAAAGAAAAAFALLFGLDRLPLAQALPGAMAAAALCLLWVGLGIAAAYGLPPLAALAAGLGLGLLLALGIGGLAGAFWGLGAGAAVAGFRAAVPALAAPRRAGRPALRRGVGPAFAGLALALAVLAGPVSAHLLQGRLMGTSLALLVALPGLALVVLARGLTPFGLGTRLLALQALAVALGLAIGSAPAAAGLLPAEGLAGFRLALLGAAFLPAFAVLQATLLSRAALAPAILSALLLAGLSAGLGPLLALAGPHLAPAGGFAAPVLATGFAFLLVLRNPETKG